MKIELPYEFGDTVYYVYETEQCSYETCEHCGHTKEISKPCYAVDEGRFGTLIHNSEKLLIEADSSNGCELCDVDNIFATREAAQAECDRRNAEAGK